MESIKSVKLTRPLCFGEDNFQSHKAESIVGHQISSYFQLSQHEAAMIITFTSWMGYWSVGNITLFKVSPFVSINLHGDTWIITVRSKASGFTAQHQVRGEESLNQHLPPPPPPPPTYSG